MTKILHLLLFHLLHFAAAKRFVAEIDKEKVDEIILNLEQNGYAIERTEYKDVLIITEPESRRRKRSLSDLKAQFPGISRLNEDEVLSRKKRQYRGSFHPREATQTAPNSERTDTNQLDNHPLENDYPEPSVSEPPPSSTESPISPKTTSSRPKFPVYEDFPVTERTEEEPITASFDLAKMLEKEISRLDSLCNDTTKPCDILPAINKIKCWIDPTCGEDNYTPAPDFTTEDTTYIFPTANTTEMHQFNDPLYKKQWTLQGHNILQAWYRGYTGKGVTVVVADDGLEWKHEDLRDNYRADVSKDINGNDDDPSPELYGQYGYKCCPYCNSCPDHGTKCAGVIAAKANNNKCIVGVAHGASIGGIRMLDGKIYDKTESDSLSFKRNLIDIYTLSWGPDDDGKMLDAPRILGQRAIEEGIKFGRNGKGSLFVWGSGNGHTFGDNCGADGYANSMFTILFAAADYRGNRSRYSESCSAILSTIYSSGSHSAYQISTVKTNNTCSSEFGGTSAVNPFAAGVIALGLEANPNLGWRDVQHMVVLSSRRELGYRHNIHRLSERDAKWQKNGAGRWASGTFGFGLFDAERFVDLADRWPPAIGKQRKCVFEWNDPHPEDDFSNFHGPTENNIYGGITSTLTLRPDNCRSQINFLEHVIVTVKVKHPERGNMQLTLLSPSNTLSTLLDFRYRDKSPNGLGIESPHDHGWSMNTVMNWGERPHGNWVFSINDQNYERNNHKKGTRKLLYWKLELYGTFEQPFNG